MFSVVLEVDDGAQPPDDPLFEAQPSPSPMAAEVDVNIKHARERQRGRRSPSSLLHIAKLDFPNSEEPATVPFVLGNPTVEIVKGVIHLYRCGDIEESRERKLPTERSATVCILGVPNSIEIPDLLRFLAPVQEGLQHVRIISGTSPNKYMALLRFSCQSTADEFYTNFTSKPFSILEPDLCHVVFVSKVEATNSRDLDLKLRFKVTELPPCAVCLERMDESITGILTTLCNHSFHCACMKSWQYTSCPVCRHTQKPETVNECSICHTTEGLWICLICGFVGCGRYLDRHSYQHFVETQHTYAMELQTQRVWDYVGDNYVHRLIQNTADGKPVEFGSGNGSAEEKVDALTLEYTYLLTSQLESQRKYFTEQMANIDAEAKIYQSESEIRLKRLEHEHKRAITSQRTLQARLDAVTAELRDERELSRSMQESQRMWEARVKEIETQKNAEIVELKEQVRDLMFCIEARDRIDSTTDEQRKELQDGHIIVADAPNANAHARRRLSNDHRRKR